MEKKNEKKEPIVNKIIRYERDKKKIISVITKEGGIYRAADDIIGTAKETHHEEYTIEGIRKVWGDMNKNIIGAENMIKALKQRIEVAKEMEKKFNPKEMEDLKEKLLALKQFDESIQAKAQLEHAESNLKLLKKDKLKLEPVMKQLPKK